MTAKEHFMKGKLKAYVIEKIGKQWDIVAQTKYYESGVWVTGEIVLTSLEYIMQKATKEKVAIYPKSMMKS